jgi:thiol:disulfide interchange protein DsbD
MNTVKSFFGVMMLAVAIYLMSRLLPATLIMALWASLLIFTGIYMGALTKSISHQEQFFQGLGIILLVYGLLILIGASQGKDNPLQPLAPTCLANTNSTTKAMTVVSTPTELNQALEAAKGQSVMLDFYADWCLSCKEMGRTTLQNTEIKRILQHFVVIRVDLTANNGYTKKLLDEYRVVAPPTFLFFNKQGKELNNLRLVGEISAANFSINLNKALI